jgi:LPS export ABC transporter protein LptC
MMKRQLTLPLCAFLVLLACAERVPGDRAKSSDESTVIIPEQVLHGSSILLSERGIKKALIKSDYLEKYSVQDSTLMAGIEATFFDSLGGVSSTLISDSGIVREKTSWLQVWGNVKVVSDNGVTLETNSLFWDEVKDSVTTESFVKITHGDNVQTGYGLQSDKSLTNIRIMREVKGEFEDIEAAEGKQQ